jgi:hypothetical protein
LFGFSEVTMKRGFDPLSVHSALPVTRLRRDQLSLVDHMKSRNTRAAWPLALDVRQASSKAGAIVFSSRWLRARPKT